MPDTIALILSLGGSEPYWVKALDYGIERNIQAVLDEYFHVLLESLGLSDKDITMIAKDIGEEVTAAVSLRTTTIEFDDVFNKSTIEVYSESLKVRCRCRYMHGVGLTAELSLAAFVALCSGSLHSVN